MPRVVPFQISLQEALNAFETWQQSHWLAPSKLLRKGLGSMHAALLPFWIFEATVHVEYAGVMLSFKQLGLCLSSHDALHVYRSHVTTVLLLLTSHRDAKTEMVFRVWPLKRQLRRVLETWENLGVCQSACQCRLCGLSCRQQVHDLARGPMEQGRLQGVSLDPQLHEGGSHTPLLASLLSRWCPRNRQAGRRELGKGCRARQRLMTRCCCRCMPHTGTGETWRTPPRLQASLAAAEPSNGRKLSTGRSAPFLLHHPHTA